MSFQTTRRDLLTASAAFFGSSALPLKTPSSWEKLNVGFVGVANRASSNVNGVAGENVVAVCDIDENYLASVAKRFPKAKVYHDYREMLDKEKLDAAVISTADHNHAPATMRALERGMHVYCEKPLSHTVEEARAVAELAAKKGVATQMGTQIHAGGNYRRVVELIQGGAIGAVKEVHVACGKGWGGNGMPAGEHVVPKHFHWDLWLGPAAERPFHPGYHPANWRRYWDFGGGTMSDMACHLMDLPFWALDLRHPTKVVAKGEVPNDYSAPHGLEVSYEFPARGGRAACELTWYDGNRKPIGMELNGLPGVGFGVLFVGEKGNLFSDYGAHRLMPEEDFADFEAPAPSIPDSIGHYAEWIKACKEGTPTTCNFDYSGALTESVLLGSVAYRAQQDLVWDAAKLTATNCAKADEFVRKEYREGWSLRG
ncbi:MAG: Gfo/Idh/MocA family oxidoreductase [Planctomycetota bacterium]|nr:Gfo/Idh/MocA family oxidoreductase [Planctomycetota bacterium]